VTLAKSGGLPSGARFLRTANPTGHSQNRLRRPRRADIASPHPRRARSSAEEHYLDMVGVTGSIPVAPTIDFCCWLRWTVLSMYENYKLCPELLPREICLVVEQYVAGTFERRYHRQVPKSSLSQERRLELLRALVSRFYGETGMGFDTIVDCHLNRRRSRQVITHLHMSTSYPEAGVLRQCCGSDTHAWCDVVVSPGSFRP
jgi:hypothetical protein